MPDYSGWTRAGNSNNGGCGVWRWDQASAREEEKKKRGKDEKEK